MASMIEAWANVNRMSADDAAAEIQRLLQSEGNPDDDDKLYEMFRHFATTRSQAAWPYIARMTAVYVEEKRPIDAFFRRAGWLLERCEDDDIAILKAAIVESRKRTSAPNTGAPKDGIQWVAHDVAGIAVHRIPMASPVSTSPVHRSRASAEHAHVVRLIVESRLGRPIGDDAGFADAEGVLVRLHSLFGLDADADNTSPSEAG